MGTFTLALGARRAQERIPKACTPTQAVRNKPKPWSAPRAALSLVLTRLGGTSPTTSAGTAGTGSSGGAGRAGQGEVSRCTYGGGLTAQPVQLW